MIIKNPKYQVECDCCGESTGEWTKKSIVKRWLVYENVTNGEVGHFCCEQCARKYIHIKKLGLEFVRVTKAKDVDGDSVGIITTDERYEFENEIKKNKV